MKPPTDFRRHWRNCIRHWETAGLLYAELTKKHETAFATTLREACDYYKEHEPKGECVLVIEGKSRKELREEAQAKWEEMTLEEHMNYYESQGISRKEAMKLVAKDRGVGKRDIYKALID